MPKRYFLKIDNGKDNQTIYEAESIEEIQRFINAKAGSPRARTDGGEK